MKLVSIELGRVVQFLVADEIRPTKGIYLAEIIRLVADRYGFGNVPTVPQVGQTGAKFQNGRLVSGDKSVNISELALHNDGIAVSTFLGTDEADFVLQDFWAWSKQAFGFREPSTKRLKIFESHFVVDFDESIEAAFGRFEPITSEMQAALKESYNYDHPVQFNRVTFSVDLASAPPLPGTRTDFWIERRVGVPFSQNRYFSACGLPTEKHLRLLERFERAAKGKK